LNQRLIVTVIAAKHVSRTRLPSQTPIDLHCRIIVGLQLPHHPYLDITHTAPAGTVLSDRKTYRLRLPRAIAIRFERFVQDHLVCRQGGYDCFSFVRYLMGWNQSGAVGLQVRYQGKIVRPTRSHLATPYIIYDTHGSDVHACMGMDVPGLSFGVGGYNFPLIIASIESLMQAFGGTTLLEAQSIQVRSGRILP
jgi:hypothetical protein